MTDPVMHHGLQEIVDYELDRDQFVKTHICGKGCRKARINLRRYVRNVEASFPSIVGLWHEIEHPSSSQVSS